MGPLQIVLSLLAVVFSAAAIYVECYQRRLIRGVRNLTPMPLSKISQLIQLNFDNTIGFVRSIADLYPIRAWITPFQMVAIIADPDDVKVVLSDPEAADKAYSYRFFQNDHGLLSSEHHIWKVHRKIINPAFSISNIKTKMIPVFKNKTDRMLHRMNSIKEGQDCELVNFIKICLVESSLATFAGVEYDKEVIEEYAQCMTYRIECVARRFLNIAFHWDLLYELTNYHRQEQKCIKTMRGLMKDIMENYSEKKKSGEETSGTLLLDLLMSRFQENQITERDVVDELDTMIYTSVDTSTHLIIFTLLMIAMNPDIQDDLVAELQSVFYSPEIPFDYDQLKKLDLMDRVIKETVRIYPIVPFAVKVAKEPIQLSNCKIPEGALTLIPIMSIHENPKLWGADAKVFNPDNFLRENAKNRHPYAYIPFSLGRNCIGKVYGKFMMSSVIASILMNYKIGTSLANEQNIQTEYKITLNLKNSNPFRLTRRIDFYNNNTNSR